MSAKMTSEERLMKAKIRLQTRSPFFSYLSLFIKLKKAREGELPEYAGMGVNTEGVLTYKDSFVKDLNDEEVIGVLCHEILHLATLHLLRRKNREPEKWNVACDLVVNSLLMKEGFKLPKGTLLPQVSWDDTENYSFKIGKKSIKKIDEKTAEQVYSEIPQLPKTKIGIKGNRKVKEGKGKSNGDGEGSLKGFDKHDESSEEKGKKKGKGNKNGSVGDALTEAEKSELENEWLNRLEEAYVSAKQKGNVPAGLERYIDELKKSQINWKALLQKYVRATIPSDYTWARRSKKSIPTKCYLPGTYSEKIDVCVAIDTSGSIGKEELTEFLSEIIGISKAYQTNLNMRMFTHDVDVHDDYEVRNGNIDKIKNIKIHGGGGTSHIPVFDKIKGLKNCKMAIFFTDGYSDLDRINFKDFNFDKIFVINKHGTEEQVENKNCITIKIKE